MYWSVPLGRLHQVHLNDITNAVMSLPPDQLQCPNGDNRCGLSRHLLHTNNSTEGKIYIAPFSVGLPVYLSIEEYGRYVAVREIDDGTYPTTTRLSCELLIQGNEFVVEKLLHFLWIGDGVFDKYPLFDQTVMHGGVSVNV